MPIIEHAKFYNSAMLNVDHSHTSCELIYVVEGNIEITVGGVTYPLSAGDSAMMKSRQRHRVDVRSDVYKRYIAFINPWEMKHRLLQPDLFVMLTDSEESSLFIARQQPDLESRFKEMSDIFLLNNNPYAELGTALLTISAFIRSAKSHRNPTGGTGKRLSEIVKAYLEEHFSDNIKISELAERNFVSVGYLTHIFTAETGMSPKGYLSHIRCSKAYELITTTDGTFTDIAAETGFCCANDMCRKIKEYCGLTPTKLRTAAGSIFG